MEVIKVIGGRSLKGDIYISGSKNASLPLMVCSLLTEDKLTLSNIPHLADIITMNHLLLNHGCKLKIDGSNYDKFLGNTIIFDGSNINNLTAPYDIVSKMRASILVVGPLLARFGNAKVSLPGGCAIGSRPVDIHLDALTKMGAQIDISEGYILAKVKGKLQGAEINFAKASVGATENILMAATLAEGTTVINNAAREPEIVELAKCLKAMGAKIKGEGSSRIEIIGVESLHGANYKVAPDRIEAGTYAIAAAITDGEITLKNIDISVLENIENILKNCGVELNTTQDGVLVKRAGDKIFSVDLKTDTYPGFSTDMQAQMVALMCIAEGTSTVTENIFENRFMHVAELNRMGAKISLDGNVAKICGPIKFKAAQVMATDLRASVSLILAALAAEGETTISRIYHLDRGYEHIESKLANCGAVIQRISK